MPSPGKIVIAGKKLSFASGTIHAVSCDNRK